MTERDIFLAAIEIVDLDERAAYVERACDSNAELRVQVGKLLQSHEQSSQFLETPAAALDSADAQTILSGTSATDDEATSGEVEFRKCLKPSTRPGWLGRLGHYEIETILGRGAFGIVAKAFDEKLHRVVAVKLMNPDLASTSPPRKRFLREARTAAAVTHENIVAIHAVEEEPIPYLVMEYIPGRTLQQRMDEHGPLDVPEVLRIGQQVAAGLAAAHAVNLIHRDIKPSNILLTDGPQERAKISDFGLARAVDDASLTTSGMIAGTPMYMAPEQARGEPLDHRADLFSLGSVLYQMISGRPPFRAANTVAVLKRVCEDRPRPLNDVIPGTPDWLESMIFRLLEKERDDRYQSAKDVADLLARCLSQMELSGKVAKEVVSEVKRSSTGARPKHTLATPTTHSPVPYKKALLIAATLLLLATTAWNLLPLRLQLTGRTSFNNLTRDGDTHIEFLQDGKVIAEQTGYGIVDIPAGEYEFRISKPNPTLAIYNTILTRRSWLSQSDTATLETPPQKLRLHAGERMEFMVAYIEKRDTTTSPDYTSSSSSPHSVPNDSLRSMQHQEKGAKDLGNFVELFNGRDLSGWKTVPGQPSNWRVEDGLLISSGTPGYLFSEQDDYEDFELTCEVAISLGSDSGVIVRSPFQIVGPNGLPGYELQIQSGQVLAEGWRTGAIGQSDPNSGWGVKQPSSTSVPSDKFFPVTIRAIGYHLETYVNGEKVAEYDDPHRTYHRGHIALQQSGANTVVKFRKIQIRTPHSVAASTSTEND